METDTQLIVGGLSALDKEELELQLGAAIGFVEPSVPQGTLAEPATIAAVITLGSIAITAFGAWLSKARQKHLLRERFRVLHPDGSSEEHVLEIQSSSEDAIKAEVIRQLRGWIKAGVVGQAGE